jgi:hypothetical protein
VVIVCRHADDLPAVGEGASNDNGCAIVHGDLQAGKNPVSAYRTTAACPEF